jgi:hypothetical protein
MIANLIRSFSFDDVSTTGTLTDETLSGGYEATHTVTLAAPSFFHHGETELTEKELVSSVYFVSPW